jgi:uncharacterized membrane-anchored protein YhcB (DUF1043 family)
MAHTKGQVFWSCRVKKRVQSQMVDSVSPLEIIQYTTRFCSAVDHFKKQFGYLEEHYAKGSTAAAPERQHNSLPR